jgi:hypothetical protein
MKTDGIERSKLNRQLIIHCGTNEAAHKTPTSSNHVCAYISKRIITFSQYPPHIIFAGGTPGIIIGICIQMSQSSSMRIELMVILFAFGRGGGDKFVYLAQ